jgi:hypothetical protein
MKKKEKKKLKKKKDKKEKCDNDGFDSALKGLVVASLIMVVLGVVAILAKLGRSSC